MIGISANSLMPISSLRYKIFNTLGASLAHWYSASSVFKEWYYSHSPTALKRYLTHIHATYSACNHIPHDLEKVIRTTLQECGVLQSATLPLLNAHLGGGMAYVYANSILFIDVNEIQKLPTQQQKALIAHEASHINHRDSNAHALFTLITPALTFLGSECIIRLFNYWCKKFGDTHNTLFKKYAMFLLQNFITQYLVAEYISSWHARSLETRADRESLNVLEDRFAAVQLLRFVQQHTPQSLKETTPFDNHPPLQTRISSLASFIDRASLHHIS
jgi:hypothetical protein